LQAPVSCFLLRDVGFCWVSLRFTMVLVVACRGFIFLLVLVCIGVFVFLYLLDVCCPLLLYLFLFIPPWYALVCGLINLLFKKKI
jgi:hypothetical protein